MHWWPRPKMARHLSRISWDDWSEKEIKFFRQTLNFKFYLSGRTEFHFIVPLHIPKRETLLLDSHLKVWADTREAKSNSPGVCFVSHDLGPFFLSCNAIVFYCICNWFFMLRLIGCVGKNTDEFKVIKPSSLSVFNSHPLLSSSRTL